MIMCDNCPYLSSYCDECEICEYYQYPKEE